MLRHEGVAEGLRNARPVLVGALAGMAILAGPTSAQAAPELPTGVGYGDVPEQVDDFIKATPKPAPLEGQFIKDANGQLRFQDYEYDKVNLDRSNKDTVRFYNGCMYGEDGRVGANAVKATRLAGSNIINASVVLADECYMYTKWRVFGTTEYKRGNMTSYVESKTTIPAYTSQDKIVNDAAYGKSYPMSFYPTVVTCKQDPTLKYRVKVVSVRYSLFKDKKSEQQTRSNVISC